MNAEAQVRPTTFGGSAAVPPRRRLGLLQANIMKSNPRLPEALASIEQLDPDIANLNEAINAVEPMRRRWKSVHLFDVLAPKRRSRGGWDTVVLLNRVRNRLIGARSTRDTEPAAPSKWAPARFTNIVRWIPRHAVNADRGKHFDVHLNAVIQSKRTGGPLLQAARTVQAGIQMRLLQTRIRWAMRRGYDVTVAGDFNYRVRPGSKVWKWAPENVFARCGLTFVRDGIDYIAYDPTRWRLVRREVIAREDTGSDHEWLYVELEAVA